MAIPEGADRPGAISVKLVDGPCIITSYAITPKGGSNSIEFAVDLKGPPQKGGFTLRAVGIIDGGAGSLDKQRRIVSNQIRVRSKGAVKQ